MPYQISDVIDSPDKLIALEPEELGGFVLEYLNSLSEDTVNRYNFSLHHTVKEYPQPHWEACQRALMEAWAYLEREGFVAHEPGADTNSFFVTRRGKEIESAVDLEALRQASLFPRESIHPEIEASVYPLFLRGEYETAIFQAFKTLEVQVRGAAGLDSTSYGVTLMRTAFHADTGPLTDQSEPKSEREALAHLFAGAIGRFKNPSSHRHVSITDPAETVEVLQFASHLLRIVDDRTE